MKTITLQAGSEDRDMRPEYRRLFDSTIADTFQQALRIIHASPGLFFTGTKIAWHQKKAADTRQEFEHQGLFVPPVMIISITSRCNLACAGCYMKQQREHHAPEMSPVLLRSVVADAAALGVSIIVIAGGEPLMRKDESLSLARSFPPDPVSALHERAFDRQRFCQRDCCTQKHCPSPQLRRIPA